MRKFWKKPWKLSPSTPLKPRIRLREAAQETALARARRLDTDGSLRRRRQLVEDNRLL